MAVPTTGARLFDDTTRAGWVPPNPDPRMPSHRAGDLTSPDLATLPLQPVVDTRLEFPTGQRFEFKRAGQPVAQDGHLDLLEQ